MNKEKGEKRRKLSIIVKTLQQWKLSRSLNEGGEVCRGGKFIFNSGGVRQEVGQDTKVSRFIVVRGGGKTIKEKKGRNISTWSKRQRKGGKKGLGKGDLSGSKSE